MSILALVISLSFPVSFHTASRVFQITQTLLLFQSQTPASDLSNSSLSHLEEATRALIVSFWAQGSAPLSLHPLLLWVHPSPYLIFTHSPLAGLGTSLPSSHPQPLTSSRADYLCSFIMKLCSPTLGSCTSYQLCLVHSPHKKG